MFGDIKHGFVVLGNHYLHIRDSFCDSGSPATNFPFAIPPYPRLDRPIARPHLLPESVFSSKSSFRQARP